MTHTRKIDGQTRLQWLSNAKWTSAPTCLALAMFSAACGDGGVHDEPPADTEADEAVYARMAELGYSREEVSIKGDSIVAQGDLLYARDGLLNGEYSPLVSAEENHDKGYRYSGLVSAANAGNIKLVFSGAPYAPSTRIIDAFTAAASEWSGVSLSAIRISTAKTGPSITIRMVNASSWPGPSNCGNDPYTLACAQVPSSGKPGAVIWIKSAIGPIDPCDYTASVLKALALHELGHAIGFAHPKESGSIQVGGTMSCAGTSSTCPSNPGYATVMNAEINWYSWPNCQVSSAGALTTDDRATIATVY